MSVRFFKGPSLKAKIYGIHQKQKCLMLFTSWKVFEYGVISDPYFPVFGLNSQNLQVGVIKLTIRGFRKQTKKKDT